jgi:hypothetical protein
MDRTLEVVVVPTGGLDRSIAFYRDQVNPLIPYDARGRFGEGREA